VARPFSCRRWRRRIASGAGSRSGAAAKERYTEHERDQETGLDYAGARCYLSAYARWNGVEPLARLFPGWSLGLVKPDATNVVPIVNRKNLDTLTIIRQ